MASFALTRPCPPFDSLFFFLCIEVPGFHADWCEQFYWEIVRGPTAKIAACDGSRETNQLRDTKEYIPNWCAGANNIRLFGLTFKNINSESNRSNLWWASLICRAKAVKFVQCAHKYKQSSRACQWKAKNHFILCAMTFWAQHSLLHWFFIWRENYNNSIHGVTFGRTCFHSASRGHGNIAMCTTPSKDLFQFCQGRSVILNKWDVTCGDRRAYSFFTTCAYD